MEHVKNRRKSYIHFVFVILSLLIVSCKSESYLDLLTGGSIRYWQLPERRFYFSFDKRTRRRMEYDKALNVSYDNGLAYLSKGEYFRIVGNRVFLSLVYDGDTVTVDTFDILKINNQKLFIRWADGNLARFVIYHRN